MYFLLQTSDGWYRSNESATESDGNYITWTANAGDLTWSAFSEFGVTGGAVAADTTDIQSVGYYSAGSNGTGALNWTGSKVINFEVTAIPEPATLGLVVAMGGGLLFIRRRFMM